VSIELYTTAQADAEIRKARQWWEANRPAAPHLLKEELSETFERVTAHPNLGTLKPRKRFPNLRWVLLRKTRYLLFYEYRAEQNQLLVLSLRSAWRKPGHRIKGR
jgi:plasmid stabilization system protein ParE